MTSILSCFAIFGLLYVSWQLLRDQASRPLWLFSLVAALLQCLALALAGSVHFFASLSWVSALMAAVASVTLMRHGERFLPLLSFLVAIATSALLFFLPSQVRTLDGWQIQLHASVALLAYASLSLAGAQAILLLLSERRLKAPRQLKDDSFLIRFASWLPPLSRLERQLFQLIFVGFLLLTLTLLSGGLFITNWFDQHLVHKTVLTFAAWLTFGVLLLGHWRFGWRGHQAALATLLGMGFLLLAFFGSKLVLELILRRV
jgi:ABC-type uncharacterized transport system permease subunit